MFPRFIIYIIKNLPIFLILHGILNLIKPKDVKMIANKPNSNNFDNIIFYDENEKVIKLFLIQ